MTNDVSVIKPVAYLGQVALFQAQRHNCAASLFADHNLNFMSAEELAVAKSIVSCNKDFAIKGSFIRERVLVVSKRIAGEETTILLSKYYDDTKTPVVMEKVSEDVASDIFSKAKKSDGSYLILDKDAPIEASEEAFANDSRTRFLFKNNIPVVVDLLRESNVSFLPFFLFPPSGFFNKSDLSYSTSIWFGGSNESHVLIGGNLSPDYLNCYGVMKRKERSGHRTPTTESPILEVAYRLIKKAEEEKTSMTSSSLENLLKKDKK